MSKDQLYSIGQMAKVTNVSIQALRYYDNTDLLKPAVIKDNGYRYYSEDQILSINVIKGLKELSFSLAEIKGILQKDDIAYVLEIFREKSREIHEQVRLLKAAQKNVASRIETLQLYDTLKEKQYIEIKNIPSRILAFTRYESPSNPVSYMKRFNELHNIIEKNKWVMTGSMMAIFHDHYTEFDYNNADIEVCAPVKWPDISTKNIRELPAGKYLSKWHLGAYDTIPQSYQYMLNWCEDNGYKMAGPAIEIYLVDFLTTSDPEKFITELQFPVEKTS